MRPKDNAEPYDHDLFFYNSNSITNMVDNEIVWECIKFVKTGNHSALVMCKLHYAPGLPNSYKFQNDSLLTDSVLSHEVNEQLLELVGDALTYI